MGIPNIGITSPLGGDEELTEVMEASYHCRAFQRIGVQPLVLRKDIDPLRVIDALDMRGILFSGGGDICASRYGGNEKLACDRLDPQRDEFEFTLMQDALDRRVPVFGICRGMQIANVLLGGTLIEDLRDHYGADYRIPHQQARDVGKAPNDYGHAVFAMPGTVLQAIIQAEQFQVSSAHHQALRDVAPVLRITAVAEDGTVEAIEFAAQDRGFFLGVQWHPERLPECRISQALYARFTQECHTLHA